MKLYLKHEVLIISSDPVINGSVFDEFPTCCLPFPGLVPMISCNALKNQLKMTQGGLSAFCKDQKCLSRKNLAQCVIPKEIH